MPDTSGQIARMPMSRKEEMKTEANGVFKNSIIPTGLWTATGSGASELIGGGTIKFNASDGNAIYGNSDTVQPPALCLIPQIKF